MKDKRQVVTDSFSLICKIKPESYNADSAKKALYKKKLGKYYDRQYKGMIQGDNLYAIVYYFHRVNNNLDIDNISKPIWDSLNKKGYDDDFQIIIRSAIGIDLDCYSIDDFEQDNIPSKDYYDLMDSILDTDTDHLLYIQVGKINNYKNIFNISELWK